MKNISPIESIKYLNKNALLLDVRAEYLTKYKQFDVKNSLLIPHNLINDNLNTIPKNLTVIIADSTGIKSKEVYSLLDLNGFSNILNLAGGMVEWERDELPIIVDINHRLTGSCMCQLKQRDKK